MADHGFSIGEVNTLVGIIGKILKAIFLISVVSSVILLETHLFGFSITNLWTDSYNFQLKELKPNYFAN